MFAVAAGMQGDLPWGSFLDAGTGRGSMAWLLGLDTTRWTAVTGAQGMADQVAREIGPRLREHDRLVVGNWTDPDLLDGETYDTVLADYLVGAMDGFAPYWQDRIFGRLRHLRLAGFRPLDAQRFAIRYGERFINSQLDMCAQRLARIKDRAVAIALSEHAAELRDRALAFSAAEGGLRHGYDYVIAAEPA